MNSSLEIPAGTAIYKYRSGTVEIVPWRVSRVPFVVSVTDATAFGLSPGWVVWHAWGSPLFAEVSRPSAARISATARGK